MTDPTIAAKEAEVERNREHLAETVDALHAKLDVKTRARAKLRDVKGRATDDAGKPRPDVVVAAATLVLALGAVIWWRKH